MPDSIYHEMLRRDVRGRWVRLRTLTTLRWLAVVGQASAVLIADRAFSIDLPFELCALAIAASILFNVISMQVLAPNTRLSERAAMLSMLFDLGQVATLLALTGGLTNPFAVLMLAPVTISASALTLRSTAVVALTALALIAGLALWNLPLAFDSGEVMAQPPIYVFGVWAALTISIFFMTFYARRVSVETFRMSRALRAAEAALSREQRLTAIGGLAAAAAHELGTPLATIKLVSGELVDELRDFPDLREDAELIRSQSDRCRDILSDLSQGGRSDEHIKRIPISALIDEAANPHEERGAHLIVRIDGELAANAGDEQALVLRSPEIVHGLRNLIQNAVEFAETTVWIDIHETDEILRVTVGDDGPGFPEDLLRRAGDPYVTSRSRQVRAGRDASSGDYQGMGLGLFIAKTLLERSGARVAFANADRKNRRSNRGEPLNKRAATGAVIAVSWPAEKIVADKKSARAALGSNKRFTLKNV